MTDQADLVQKGLERIREWLESYARAGGEFPPEVREQLASILESHPELFTGTMFSAEMGFNPITAPSHVLADFVETAGGAVDAGAGVATGDAQETLDAVRESLDPGRAEQAEVSERERLESMRNAYIAAGTDERTIQIVEDNDGSLILVWNDPATGLTHELNDEQVDLQNIGEGRTRDTLTGDFTTVPPPRAPDDFQFSSPATGYIVDPNYRVDIDVDDYFAMLRWLDPKTKTTVEDRQRVTRMYSPIEGMIESEFVGEGLSDTEFGLNQRAGLVNSRTARRTYDMIGGPDKISVGPKYARGDEVALFVGRSSEYIASMQQLLIESNVLDKSEIGQPGFWGMAEEAAMANLLPAADMRGMTIDQFMQQLAENPLPEDKGPGFVTPVYQAPDMATLSQDLKGVFRNRLGRNPEPYEMDDLIRQMEADHYADYQSQVEAARMEWEARREAIETGADQTTGQVRQVDPFSRFKEKFDELYTPEMDRNQEVIEGRNNVANMMNRLAGIEGAI